MGLKLNLKEFDFKDFMFRKGERVALSVMVVVMAMLVVFGIINGFSRGSSGKISGDLNSLHDAGQRAVATSAPRPEELVVRPEFLKAATLAPLDISNLLCVYPFFTNLASEDRKWRKPDVLTPDEFQVDVRRGLARSFLYTTRNGGKPAIWWIKEGKKDKSNTKTGPMAGMRNGFFPGGRMPQGFFPGGRMPGMAQMGNMMQQPQQEEKQEVAMEAVLIEDLAKGEQPKEGKPAEATLPYRMAIVQATFPYRQEFDVFKRSLRYGSIEEMEQQAAVEFVALNVQRRELDPNGRTTEWKDLDIVSMLRPLLIYHTEPEDQELLTFGIVWQGDRLVMPRPGLARDMKWPEPDRLIGIEKTREFIRQESAKGTPPPKIEQKNRFEGDFDVFEAAKDATTKDGKNPALPAFPKGKGKRVTMPGPAAGPAAGPGAAGGFANQERLIPEKCLVRFIDITLQPGYTYEYRVQIKMANPLFGKKTVAISKGDIEEQFIYSEWKDVGKKVTTPTEMEFFCLDDSPKARNYSVNPNRIWVQIHRWCETVPINPAEPRGTQTGVGDWTIADSASALRGEYVGGWEEVELPVWDPRQEAFVLAQHPEEVKRKGPRGPLRVQKHKGVAVDFFTGNLLVDFDGGKKDFAASTKDGRGTKVNDQCSVEALILQPDGKLVVRSARTDVANKKREERFKRWTEWVKAVREKADESKGSGGSGTGGRDDPFSKKPAK